MIFFGQCGVVVPDDPSDRVHPGVLRLGDVLGVVVDVVPCVSCGLAHCTFVNRQLLEGGVVEHVPLDQVLVEDLGELGVL